MEKQKIQLGHSPDPDDAFMFYALATGAVDSGPYEFEHVLQDIQTLNDWAQEGRLEITAISMHAYPYVQDRYAILSSGASMGGTELSEYVIDEKVPLPKERGQRLLKHQDVHGPLLVAPEGQLLENLTGKTIGVPGTLTSAFLTLKLALGEFDYRVIMFDEIPDAVKDGEVDAGLLIHEGQLTYRDYGLTCLLDLGKWWFDTTTLPLPLGCNVIRRDLGDEAMHRISGILKESILYGLNHRKEAVEYALQFGRGLDDKMADRFVGMYVNEWTLDFGPKGRQAVRELLQRGAKAGYVPEAVNLEFV